MTYREAVDWLHSLQVFGVKLGLDNMRILLQSFAAPERAAPCVLVTGSNGKGSVVAMLTAVARARGLRVGTYTSPHLVRVEERIAIDQEPIRPRRLADTLTVVRARIERLLGERALAQHPTFFEVMTTTAFLEFRRATVGLSVLEIGMGGRFDATNVAEPLVSTVTNVALEHERWLGSTIAAIAFEKAGIARAGRPLVIGSDNGEALRRLTAEARARGACPVLAARRVNVRASRVTRRGIHAHITTPRGDYPELFVPLTGRHQIPNLRTAIATLEALPAELQPSTTQVRRGLRHTRWPGRLEYVPGRPRLLLDGAHNPHAAGFLADYLDSHERGRRVLVFGCLADKDITGLIQPLLPLFRHVVLTPIASPRAAATADLRRVVATGGAEVVEARSTAHALRIARALAGSRGLVVVCGSLYLVGEVKALIGKRTRQEIQG